MSLPWFVEILGVINEILSLVKFGTGDVPQGRSSGKSRVRIILGLDLKTPHGGETGMGGDIPDIYLWNEIGGFLGVAPDPGKVQQGRVTDVTVKHRPGAGEQATYTLFSANDDAVCIASAAITWPDGGMYGWVGDWGHQCGGSWYYSNIYVAGTHKPDCLWIGTGDHQPQTGFQVHWPDFVNTRDWGNSTPEERTQKIDYLCKKQVPFGFRTHSEVHPRSLIYWKAHTPEEGGQDERNGTAVAYGPKKPAHKWGLCESETSYGPDFVDVKTGTFCRMSDKSLWPTCKGTDGADNCFNIDSQQLIINGLVTRGEPYKKVLNWITS
ncbi:hypothetical protein F4802DRAFT_611085 [Xylaria palmicola]|nr:hypothetical protein F4802DRAFT_611085 [Xylaria palmicola]